MRPRLLSVREAASLLGVCTSTVYKLCAEGKLRHVRVSNAIRISEAALRSYGCCESEFVRLDTERVLGRIMAGVFAG
jgi:excisionase family DNA binding protein